MLIISVMKIYERTRQRQHKMILDEYSNIGDSWDLFNIHQLIISVMKIYERTRQRQHKMILDEYSNIGDSWDLFNIHQLIISVMKIYERTRQRQHKMILDEYSNIGDSWDLFNIHQHIWQLRTTDINHTVCDQLSFERTVSIVKLLCGWNWTIHCRHWWLAEAWTRRPITGRLILSRTRTNVLSWQYTNW